jgi:serine/threonine protein kinase
LKVISVELAEDEQFRSRFQREAAIAPQIEHPNVIPVHAVGEVNGTLFIAMRFVEGLDLRALLAQEGLHVVAQPGAGARSASYRGQAVTPNRERQGSRRL